MMFNIKQLDFLADFLSDSLGDLIDEISAIEEVFLSEERLAELKEDEFTFELVTQNYKDLKHDCVRIKEILEIIRKGRVLLYSK